MRQDPCPRSPATRQCARWLPAPRGSAGRRGGGVLPLLIPFGPPRRRVRGVRRGGEDAEKRPVRTAVVFIATVPQGGQPSNRKLLDRVESVLGTLDSVKKCIRLKFEKLTIEFYFNEIIIWNNCHKGWRDPIWTVAVSNFPIWKI